LDHLRRRGQIWDDGDGTEQVVDIDRPSTDVRRSPAVEQLLADDSPPPSPRPSDMPQSWGSDKSELWRSLSDDARAAVQEREDARDAELRRRQNETVEAQRQTEARWKAVEQQRAAEQQQVPASPPAL
jgi:hypothetical protein